MTTLRLIAFCCAVLGNAAIFGTVIWRGATGTTLEWTLFPFLLGSGGFIGCILIAGFYRIFQY